MKRISFLAFLIIGQVDAIIFNGGSGDGEGSARAVQYLNGNPTIFSGGGGDGFDRDESSNLLGDPSQIDSDGDGIPDQYEALNGLLINTNDADLDLDGDGDSNLTEYLFCTDPQNPSDNTVIRIALGAGATSTTLLWPGIAGKSYQIYLSHDLQAWGAISQVTAVRDGPQATTLLLDGDLRAFFRLGVNR